MGFRLVVGSTKIGDFERPNGRVVCVISPNSLPFCAYYEKVVEDTPIHSASECSPKNLVFSGISLMAIFAGDHPQRGR